MSAATIPMPGDVAKLIGDAAQFVENRSLLLDKFVFHKRWPVVEEQKRHHRDFVKWDEASRWSFMRIADRAEQILNREAQEKGRKAGGKNVEPQNRDRLNAEAKIAKTLANVKWDGRELQSLRSRHTRHFIGLLLEAYGERAAITIGQLEGRLAINLADSLIQNAGVCLDRIFGLPYIPGSAVKGVCRHAALVELKSAPEAEISRLLSLFCATFGTSEIDFKSGDLSRFRDYRLGRDRDSKGAVAFLPAYPASEETRLVVDLTNVHYPDYYRDGRAEDQSKENPRPNPFPAVEIGAQFAFCLVLNGMDMRPDVLAAAKRWLEVALTERGLGAKTAAGYGWFSLKPEVLVDLKATWAAERLARNAKFLADAEMEQLAREKAAYQATLSPEAAAAEMLLGLPDDRFAAFAKDLAHKPETEQRAFISLLASAKEKRDRWKIWKKRKPEIAEAVEAVRASLNLPALP